MRTRLSVLAGMVVGIGIIPASALSAGFQISEQTVTGLGRAFAGSGVAGDDASDLFYTPAALMLEQDRQFQLGVTFISPSAQFSNQGSTQRLTTPAGPVTVPSRGPDADGGESALVPNLFYTFPSENRWRFGFGITAPFGLSTSYDSQWVGRYHALKSELKTIDLNPAVGYRVNETVSIGAGLSIQQGEVELSQAQFLGPGTPDGRSRVEMDSTSVGWNLGAMFEVSPTTRFGLGYRSKVSHDADGDLTLTGTAPAPVKLSAEGSIDLPETVYLSARHEVNDRLALLAGARWTKWSRFKELRLEFGGGLPDSVTDENWDDVWMLNLGFNYDTGAGWVVRGGYAYDQSPVPDAAHRTPRIPDTDRNWLTLGASYAVSDSLSIDFAYAHLFTSTSKTNNTVDLVSTAPGAFTDTLVGAWSDTDTDLVGVQITKTWR
jgi:long-chain fatty acid transport protein